TAAVHAPPPVGGGGLLSLEQAKSAIPTDTTASAAAGSAAFFQNGFMRSLPKDQRRSSLPQAPPPPGVAGERAAVVDELAGCIDSRGQIRLADAAEARGADPFHTEGAERRGEEHGAAKGVRRGVAVARQVAHQPPGEGVAGAGGIEHVLQRIGG